MIPHLGGPVFRGAGKHSAVGGISPWELPIGEWEGVTPPTAFPVGLNDGCDDACVRAANQCRGGSKAAWAAETSDCAALRGLDQPRVVLCGGGHGLRVFPQGHRPLAPGCGHGVHTVCTGCLHFCTFYFFGWFVRASMTSAVHERFVNVLRSSTTVREKLQPASPLMPCMHTWHVWRALGNCGSKPQRRTNPQDLLPLSPKSQCCLVLPPHRPAGAKRGPGQASSPRLTPVGQGIK